MQNNLPIALRDLSKIIIIIKRTIVGAVLVVGGYFLISSYQEKYSAINLFAKASTIEQLQTVVSHYPRSNVTASALLLLAEKQRQQGSVRESNTTYEKFLVAFPKHSLAPAAALGIAENTLTSGHLSVGVAKLQTLVAKYPASYVAPFSLCIQAEFLMMQLGRISEAKRQLNNLVSEFPDSIFSRYSSAKLLFLFSARQLTELSTGQDE